MKNISVSKILFVTAILDGILESTFTNLSGTEISLRFIGFMAAVIGYKLIFEEK